MVTTVNKYLRRQFYGLRKLFVDVYISLYSCKTSEKMSRKRLTGAKVLEMIDDMSSEESSSDSAENDSSNSDDTELYDPSSDDAQEPSEADTDEDDDVDDVTVGWQQMKPTHPIRRFSCTNLLLVMLDLNIPRK